MRLVALSLLLALLTTVAPALAHAVTFEEAARARGYTYSSTGIINVNSMNIDDLAGVNNYTTADMIWADDNAIPGIDTNQFAGMDSLLRLDLNRNRISSIESGDFSGLTDLRLLYLVENRISSIGSGGFSGLTNLRMLNLGGNDIPSMEPGSLSGLGHLQELNLNYNQISIIESGSLAGLTNLQLLSLWGNQITSIESVSLSGLENLRELYLGYNRITSIKSGDLSPLMNLQGPCLSLRYNQITSIDSRSFSGLGNLQYLDLTRNSLTHLNLSGADFVEMYEFRVVDGNSIKSVDLSTASLSDLAFGALMGDFSTGDIGTMDLSGADLSAVASLSPMYGLHDLVKLDLPFAELADVDELDDLVLELGSRALSNLTISWDQWRLMDVTTRAALTDWDSAPANTLAIIPEPSTLALLAIAALTFTVCCWRRRQGA